MKTHFLIGIKLTLISIIILVVLYSLVIWGAAKIIAPNKGNVEWIYEQDKTVGSALVGQAFTQQQYFQGRPSAVDYNGGGSGGSNKAPSNQDYLNLLEARIDTFLKYNPTVKKPQIPSELITASGSGLDPHISVESAFVQANRIATARNIEVEKVNQLIEMQTEKPFLGLFGTSKIHVLKLNLALDNLK